MKKIILLILSAFFIFAAVACAPDTTENLDPNVIRAMTFNMRYESETGPIDGDYRWKNRKQGIVETLSNHNVTVVGTQELREWQHKELMPLLGSKWSSVGDRPAAINKREYNNILYRNDIMECVSWETIWLSETPNVPDSKSWETQNPRMLTYAKFKMKETNKEFYFFNTHLDHVSDLARKKGIELIATYLDKYTTYPMILTGDFNIDMESSAANFVPLTSRENFSDSYTPFEPKFGENRKTFHGYNGGTKGTAIDFIFYSTNSLNATGTDIIYDMYNENIYVSDHYPVLSVFTFI